jgi:hypothetical protein
MRGIEARLRRLELDAGRGDDIENLSDDELAARIYAVSEVLAHHPDSTPEEKEHATALLAELDADRKRWAAYWADPDRAETIRQNKEAGLLRKDWEPPVYVGPIERWVRPTAERAALLQAAQKERENHEKH